MRNSNFDDSGFFRNDEQAEERLPIGNQGETRSPHGSR